MPAAAAQAQPKAGPAAPAAARAPAPAAAPSDGGAENVAWRHRFTHKWRRARHIDALERFESDSPDPIAFIAAHGAAATACLAANAPPAAGAAAGGGAPRPTATATVTVAARKGAAELAGRPSRLQRDASKSRLDGPGTPVAAGAAASVGGSGASSYAGSLVLPRVFSGGEMHRKLVAEAQRANAALEQLSEAQQREEELERGAAAAAARGGGEDGGRHGPEEPWVGQFLPAVPTGLSYPAVSHDAYVLVRVVDASRRRGAAARQARPPRSKVVLRARAGFGAAGPGAAPLLSELEAEVYSAAAAARLPQTVVELQLLGSGALLKAGQERIKVVPGALGPCGAAPAPLAAGRDGGMAPAAAAALAAALLRQCAPREWAVLQ